MNPIPPCESAQVEFKPSWSDSIKKELVAFANSQGGELFIGVDDSGEVVGVDDPDKLIRRTVAIARDNIYPSINSLICFKRITVGDKKVLDVLVSPGTEKPYCTDPDDISTIYVRVGSESMRPSCAQIARFVERIPWESRIAKNQELTFNYYKAFARSRNLNFNPEGDFFYGFVDSKSREFTNLAFLCSEQNLFAIAVNVFSDDEKTELVKSKTFYRSILKSLQDAKSFIMSECLIRSVPFGAVQEALVNMIAHRDYTRTEPSVVNIMPSRVEFRSPGGPADLTEEEIMLQIASNCRNARLANFLKAVHLMACAGSGLSAIRGAYNNIPLSQLIQVLPASFLISLPRMIFSERPENKRAASADPVKRSIDESILGYLKAVRKATRKDVECRMNMARSTALYWIQKLVKEGRIYKAGRGKNTFYKIDSN